MTTSDICRAIWASAWLLGSMAAIMAAQITGHWALFGDGAIWGAFAIWVRPHFPELG